MTNKKNRPTNKNGAFSPDKFRASFANGLGSTSYFQLRFTRLPPFMIKANVNRDILRLLPMHIKRAQIPDMTLQTNPVVFGGGMPVEYPYENSTSPLTIEVVSSSNLWEREFFTMWQNYIIDYSTSNNNPTYSIAYFKDYVIDLELDYYNEEGERTATFKFESAYPKTLTSVDLDWGTRDVLVFNVELQYSYWSITHTKSNIKGNPLSSDPSTLNARISGDGGVQFLY